MNKEEIKDSYLSTDDISKMSDEDLCEKYLNVQGEGTLEDYCKLDDELKKRLSNSNNKVEDFGKGTIKVLPKELGWLDIKQRVIQEYKKKLLEEIEKIKTSDYSNKNNNFELNEDDIISVISRIKSLINKTN